MQPPFITRDTVWLLGYQNSLSIGDTCRWRRSGCPKLSLPRDLFNHRNLGVAKHCVSIARSVVQSTAVRAIPASHLMQLEAQRLGTAAALHCHQDLQPSWFCSTVRREQTTIETAKGTRQTPEQLEHGKGHGEAEMRPGWRAGGHLSFWLECESSDVNVNVNVNSWQESESESESDSGNRRGTQSAY